MSWSTYELLRYFNDSTFLHISSNYFVDIHDLYYYDKMHLSNWYILPLLLILKYSDAFDPVIQTPVGKIRGLELADKKTGMTIYEFRGIRFAKPPIGERRFRKPVPVEPWVDTYDATNYGSACPQTEMPFIQDGSFENQSEDCLFLNIFVPRTLNDKRRLSVMVWIHGGAFLWGNGHYYDGTRLAIDGDVIIVTINYRLGVLGFLGLHHPASRGNYGLWDQILALKWVQGNIASFRGDPDSVTIFGESAGGSSVSYLTLIPSNKGLFHRAIAQSGVASRLFVPGRKSVKKIIERLSERLKCAVDDLFLFVECLRIIDVQVLMNSSDFFEDLPKDHVLIEMLYAPIVDGELFPNHPMLLLEDQSSSQSHFFSSLDFMTGVMGQEGSLIYTTVMPDVQELYGIDIFKYIPRNFLCEAIIKPYVSVYYEGHQNITQMQDAICTFYTTNGSDNEQSNKAADFVGDMMFNIITAQMLEYHCRSGKGRTFQYQISKLSPRPYGGTPPPWFKRSGHADELSYFFQIEQDKGGTLGAQLTDIDKKLASTMIAYWTSFAKTGIPSAGEQYLPWLQYTPGKKIYMDFNVDLSLKQNLFFENIEFWTNEIPPIPIDMEMTRNEHDEL